MDRKETLEKALEAVTRRPKAYGPPEQNFERIARRWNTHLVNVGIFYDPRVISDPGAHNGITAIDVAAMMADMKLARLEETPDHDDSWIDLAGYAACGAEVSGVAKTPNEETVAALQEAKRSDLPAFASVGALFGDLNA